MPRRKTPATPAQVLAKPAATLREGSLPQLRREARTCRACPLWAHATQTVFGEGPADATMMLIGEQPGAQEDLSGRPFVGPAGALLDRALEEAGLTRAGLYLTNTVKHFKYEPRGKLRLHKRANAAEQDACRQWLAAELATLRPRLIVAMGSMAAQALFGGAFRVTRERGKLQRLAQETEALATWHPSAVLRAPAPGREQLYQELVADLRAARRRALTLRAPKTANPAA
jgi:uracil-DNA glycosylase